MLAVVLGRLSITEILIDAGANINTQKDVWHYSSVV